MNIRIPRKDDENRLMGPPIIELEFKKDTLDPHIVRGENIQLQMKKERPTLCERCLQFGHKKSIAEVTGNSAQTVQTNCRREEYTIVDGTFASTAKYHTRQETRKYVKNIKWKQQPSAK